MKLTAYCVSKRKKVTISKIKNIWKSKGRGHFLYLIEGEAPGCDVSVWRAIGEDDAHKLAKEHKLTIKLRVSKKKKTKKVKKEKTKKVKKTKSRSKSRSKSKSRK